MPITTPLTLPITGTWLDKQVRAYLLTDTDPQAGLLAALAQRVDDAGVWSGANSVYPNFTTDGPSDDRATCPTPFLMAESGGAKAHPDGAGRDLLVAIEIHDDPAQGDLRWRGLYERLEQRLAGWQPTSDGLFRYIGGLMFESVSRLEPDERYNTNSVQVVFKVQAVSRSSLRGRQG